MLFMSVLKAHPGVRRLLHCNMSYMPMLNSVVKRVLLHRNKISGFFIPLASAA
jgi:hypothetical protein